MTSRQRAQLFHELSKLIGAGLHLDRSVDLLLDQKPASAMRKWLDGLKRGLAEHLSVADSIAKYTESPPLEVSLLAAGERGGRLEAACSHLAGYYLLRKKSQDKALGALAYPLILLHLGLVLPDVPRLVMGEGSMDDFLLQMAIRLGLLWAGLAVFGFLLFSAMKIAISSSVMDRLLNAVPLLGGVRRHWALARFCQVFQTGLLAAFRMSETLHLAGDASQSAILSAASKRAGNKLESGTSLAASMKGTDAFPRTFMQSVATAEETGTLDREMQRWAVAEAEMAAQAQDRLAEWLPRIFYVLVVFYIASRIISMVSGIYNDVYKPILES